MDLGLDGQVVYVGGASKGLGRATAIVLAREGARLSLAARDGAALDTTATLAREAGARDVVTWKVDLTDPDAVRSVVAGTCERLGTINRVVNNVGGPEYLPATGFLDFDDAAWQRAFETVTMIAVRTCREVLPILVANGKGSIVNVSGNAVRGHIPSMGQHESQKAAICHITKSLAKEFAPTVRVNAVLPGGMTDPQHRKEVLEPRMAENGWTTEAEYVEAMNRRYYEITWAQRLGETEEVANVIAFLLSDRASYVSGAWYNVDGGSGPG